VKRRLRYVPYGKNTLEIGNRTLIMGILNTTPDSFSDGGQFVSVEAAVERARRMVEEGADIIDVGGESTRPGSEPVSADEEMRRILPVIEAISYELDVPVSVDTYKADVAKRALNAGAHIINDVWGFKKDPMMPAVAAAYGCPVVLMHNRVPRPYTRFIEEVIADLRESIDIAKKAGVADHSIILDPGIGFAKTREDNLVLMNRLSEIVDLGYPVLLGTSRKSFIRNTLRLPSSDVIEGTAATIALGIFQGCSIMRVHDVKEMKRAAVMTDAIMQSSGSEGRMSDG
jgi:dihydropteroate synthase